MIQCPLFKIRCSHISKIMTNGKVKGELSVGAQSYLKEWYSEQIYQDREEIRSKYMDKGNTMEIEAIHFSLKMLRLGMYSKNEEYFDDGFITGTPDILTKSQILDTKCSWNGKTFLEAVTEDLNPAYYWQMIGYMGLTGRKEAKVCYCLMDTFGIVNYGVEITYEKIPEKMKFHAKKVGFDEEKYQEIIQKVILCRKFLDEYHAKIMEVLK